jgi:hypothetical protein
MSYSTRETHYNNMQRLFVGRPVVEKQAIILVGQILLSSYY